VWDRGQTKTLALQFWPDAVTVGTGFRRPLLAKATAIWGRGAELARRFRSAPPDAALSHNSYSQIVAGRLLGIPTVTAMDYEHQPANHLAFRLAHRVLLPEAIAPSAVRRFGCPPGRVLRYAGLKEDISLSTFRPDPRFRSSIGVDADEPLVTVRPPAEGALYHRRPNDLLQALLPRLAATGARVILSPRTRSQGERFAGVPGVTLLRDVVSGPDLAFHSDVVIGAGGTMTREAAVLGTTTYSVFMGRPAAVDEELARQGRLHVLRRPDDFPSGPVAQRGGRAWDPDGDAVPRFLSQVMVAVQSAASRPPSMLEPLAATNEMTRLPC
jgi:predicted glycosyltransferase